MPLALAFSVGTFTGAALHWVVVKHYVLSITADHAECTAALGRQSRDMEQIWRSLNSPFVTPKYRQRLRPKRS